MDVFVVVFLWWCGGVFVVVWWCFLWWCFCGGVVWCFCGVFVFFCQGSTFVALPRSYAKSVDNTGVKRCLVSKFSLHCSYPHSHQTFPLFNCLHCFRDIRRLVLRICRFGEPQSLKPTVLQPSLIQTSIFIANNCLISEAWSPRGQRRKLRSAARLTSISGLGPKHHMFWRECFCKANAVYTRWQNFAIAKTILDKWTRHLGVVPSTCIL